ncbi:MAG: LPS assembly lipoprotein LptE [Myxococcota bacterium]
MICAHVSIELCTRRGRVRALLAWGVASLVLLVGCGYRPLAAPRAADGSPLRIELQSFENRSREPGLEALISQALAEEITRRGLRPVYGSGDPPAQLRLSGRIREVQARASAFSSAGLALEYELSVGLDVSLSRVGGDLVWRHRDLRLLERYSASADPQAQASNREQALRRMAAGLAGRIQDELAQGL